MNVAAPAKRGRARSAAKAAAVLGARFGYSGVERAGPSVDAVGSERGQHVRNRQRRAGDRRHWRYARQRAEAAAFLAGVVVESARRIVVRRRAVVRVMVAGVLVVCMCAARAVMGAVRFLL